MSLAPAPAVPPRGATMPKRPTDPRAQRVRSGEEAARKARMQDPSRVPFPKNWRPPGALTPDQEELLAEAYRARVGDIAEDLALQLTRLELYYAETELSSEPGSRALLRDIETFMRIARLQVPGVERFSGIELLAALGADWHPSDLGLAQPGARSPLDGAQQGHSAA